MHLLIARHGETLWNVEKRIQGWGDSPLTETGRSQARQLAARLSDVVLTAVYSSDLGRAFDTANIIADGRQLCVAQLPELREVSWGDWEGQTAAQIQAVQPDLWAKFISRGREMNESEDEADWETSTVVPGGETLTAAASRISSALAKIKSDHPRDDEWVLVVGHGGSLRFFVTLALGLPPRRIRRLHLDNASLTHILYLRGHPPIVNCINDTGHHGSP
jgi:broad specificity phosphatase PhoE